MKAEAKAALRAGTTTQSVSCVFLFDLFDLAIFLAANWGIVYAREFQTSPEWAGRNQNDCTFIKSEYTGFVQNTTDMNGMNGY